MDVELKTGRMARMPVGHDANTKRPAPSHNIQHFCIRELGEPLRG
jgi:hypothetical protein